MPTGYTLYKAQDGATTSSGPENRARGIYPDKGVAGGVHSRGSAARGQSWSSGSGGGADPLAGFGAALDRYLASQGIGGLGGSSQSTSSQPVLPPALELLQEMRMRRESEANQATALAEMLSANTPQGQKYYLGMEPGGMADVLMGIITGNGPSAGASLLPEDQRAVRRTNVPFPMEGQPPVGQEAGEAMDIGNAILNFLRNIQTGQSSSQQG